MLRRHTPNLKLRGNFLITFWETPITRDRESSILSYNSLVIASCTTQPLSTSRSFFTHIRRVGRAAHTPPPSTKSLCALQQHTLEREMKSGSNPTHVPAVEPPDLFVASTAILIKKKWDGSLFSSSTAPVFRFHVQSSLKEQMRKSSDN
ncbi:hypothetical protein CDAR_470001 [Caerostris darwini]|uniref:Uncharacterized protein n=1 Tax=Caerostris darwini TaxID=1538125 RepID=A0AAV4RUK5_9ARAC|nr:hypothetical protein CDAR_470001 [Caerostris darwini]